MFLREHFHARYCTYKYIRSLPNFNVCKRLPDFLEVERILLNGSQSKSGAEAHSKSIRMRSFWRFPSTIEGCQQRNDTPVTTV